MKRRTFLTTAAVSGSGLLLLKPHTAGAANTDQSAINTLAPKTATGAARLPDLAPARWVWYPSERCLQNTFVLFRRDLQLREKPRRATGWIAPCELPL